MTGCLTYRHNSEVSVLKIEGKKRNSLIENRKPDYGNGHRDGCIVEDQISMNIVSLNDKHVSGNVTDSKTIKPVPFASIKLIFRNSDTLKTIVDSMGKFDINYLNELSKIQAGSIGYRTLSVNLKSMK